MRSLFWLWLALLLAVPVLGVGCGEPFEAGTGGAGGGTESCATESDCLGSDTACRQIRCSNGLCGFNDAAAGTMCETGTCDGAGMCVECIDNATCGGEICIEGQCVPVNCGDGELNGNETDLDCGGDCPACDNGDNCVTWTDCASAFCDNGVCGPCSAHTDCPSAGYCDPSGNCTPKKNDGDPCSNAVECLSGQCPGQDDVCCATSCEGECQACRFNKTNLPNGECHAVAGDSDPDNECAVEDASTCGNTGECSGGDGCALHPQNTSCGGNACNGNGVAPQICDGQGACVAGNIITPCAIACGAGQCLSCGMNPPPNAPNCPAICGNNCAGGVCQIDCGVGDNCGSATVVCPPGLACVVVCSGVGSCEQTTVTCSPGHACTMNCTAADADLCKNADIACGSGTCTVNCGNGLQSCQGLTQTCGTNACTATCAGDLGAGIPLQLCGNACMCGGC